MNRKTFSDVSVASSKKTSTASIENQPTVALLHCYDLIDQFLDSIDISFETFCREFLGSWMFGYINALQKAGVRTVIFCISERVKEPTRFKHEPTGATICSLPPWGGYQIYQQIRRKSLTLYGAKEGESFTNVVERQSTPSRLGGLKNLVQSLGSYCCTPLPLLARELKRENCQAIICQEYEYARFDACVLLGKLIKIPVYGVFQGGDRTQSPIESLWRKWTLQHCAGTIVAPEKERDRLQKTYQLSPDKIAPIFNPLDLEIPQTSDQARQSTRQQLGIDTDATVVVWHGRVEIKRKGLDLLVQAWKQVTQTRRGQNLCLLLVGTGGDAKQLQQQIASLELTNIVWINEFISDRHLLTRYLTAADVYIFPSRQEGFPLAPIEAMACQLPVVAANAAGVADILGDGCGQIVACDDYNALANALGEVLDNPLKRQQWGKLAQQRAASCFAPEAIGKQLREVLLNESRC